MRKGDLIAGFGGEMVFLCSQGECDRACEENSKGQSNFEMELFHQKRGVLKQKKAFFETKRGCF